MDDAQKESFNPYKILNLPEDASQKEVKSRFHSLSRAFHPDKQPPELFRESSQQFEKIELAYKTLSTPMRKYVYDKYGSEGIKVCQIKAGKLEGLEEEFKHTVTEFEEAHQEEANDEIQKREAKARMKIVQEKIRENIEFHHKRLEEEHLLQKHVKENSILCNLNLTDVIDYYIKRTTHASQGRAASIKPYVTLGGIGLHHWTQLPDYRGIQHMIGAFVNHSSPEKNDYAIGYRFRKSTSNLIKGSEIAGTAQVGDQRTECGLTFAKQIDNDTTLSLGASSDFKSKPSFTAAIQRRIDENFVWHTHSQYDMEGDGTLLTGISREFKRWDLKLDGNVQLSQDRVNVSQTLSRPITKKLSAHVSCDMFLTPGPIFQFKLGYNYIMNSYSKFSFNSIFIATSAMWELKYSRFGFKVRLPITLGQHVNQRVILFSLAVTGVGFYLTYLYDKYRKRTERHLKKLERKHRSRLMDGRRLLNSTNLELHNEAVHKIAYEIENKGIVVLKALYGYGPYIKELYRTELSKWSYRRIFKATQPIEVLLEDAHKENEKAVEEKKEVVDLQVILQCMVSLSMLRVSLEKLEETRGVYNPCFDDINQPHLLLVVHLNGKIFITRVQKKGRQLELSKDYDEFLKESQVEGKYNLKTMLSAI